MWPFIPILILLILSPVWLPRLGSFLVVGDPLRKTDALVPLGGGDHARFETVAELFREGYAPVVITTGELVPDYFVGTPYEKTLAELGAEQLEHMGVTPESIIVMKKGTSTYDEAQALRGLCRERRYDSLLVVTSIYHTRRARAVFRRVLDGAGIDVVVRPAENSVYSTDRWWTREKDLVFVHGEWMKLILYYLQGKI